MLAAGIMFLAYVTGSRAGSRIFRREGGPGGGGGGGLIVHNHGKGKGAGGGKLWCGSFCLCIICYCLH